MVGVCEDAKCLPVSAVSSGEDVVGRDDGTTAEEVAGVFKGDLPGDLFDGGGGTSYNLSVGEDIVEAFVVGGNHTA